ncbi:hypothetical protein LJR153_007369 [Paenibacillus sp. LjRoot153]
MDETADMTRLARWSERINVFQGTSSQLMIFEHIRYPQLFDDDQ